MSDTPATCLLPNVLFDDESTAFHQYVSLFLKGLHGSAEVNALNHSVNSDSEIDAALYGR